MLQLRSTLKFNRALSARGNLRPRPLLIETRPFRVNYVADSDAVFQSRNER